MMLFFPFCRSVRFAASNQFTWCSNGKLEGGIQVGTSLSSCCHTCTHLGILIAGEVEEKQELKNLLMWGKFSLYLMVDRELLTYVKNKNQLTLIVNKKLKIVNGAV